MRDTEMASARLKRVETRRPTFMIPGVGKSGTSSLYEYLGQHPDIFMTPRKEPGFFNWDERPFDLTGPVDARLHRAAVRDPEAYAALFSGRERERAAGEATPNYLYGDHARERIFARYPDLSFIVILRHPVERLFSHYLHMRRMGDEPLSLEDAIDAEPKRRAAGWGASYHYVAQGFYAAQLERWFERFDRERFHFILYEDFARDPGGVTRGAYAFLGVDDSFVPETRTVHNAHYAPRSALVHRLVSGEGAGRRLARRLVPRGALSRASALVRSANAAPRPSLAPALHNALLATFLDDIARLARLLDRDLSAWTRERPLSAPERPALGA